MQFPQERLTTALTAQYPPVIPPLPASQRPNSCASCQSPSRQVSRIPHSQKTELRRALCSLHCSAAVLRDCALSEAPIASPSLPHRGLLPGCLKAHRGLPWAGQSSK